MNTVSVKTIATSLALIVGVAAIVVGATGAFFSDTETSSGNTFAAGTLDLTVDGGSWTSPAFIVDDALPGDLDPAFVSLAATQDVWLRFSADFSTSSVADQAVLDAIDYRVYETTDGSTYTELTPESDGSYYASNYLAETATTYQIGFVSCFGTYDDNSTPTDISDDTCDGSLVGNASQGGSLSVDFTIEALQYQNNESQSIPW